MNRKLTVGISTLGCKVNQYESEAIAEAFTDLGLELKPFDEVCDIYVINTCTVTAESDRKARQMIRRAIRRSPEALTVVTGCFAEASPERAASIDGVDIVCGNLRKMDAVRLALDFIETGRRPASPIISVPTLEGASFEPMRIRKSERTRAYIKIEDGCEGKCAYCIIPSVRGPVRSKPISDIADEARGLVSVGYREIVLTGIETSAFSPGLPELLRSLSEIDGLERIRFGSLDPASMGKAFADTVAALPCVMPHFHVSLQSGCDATLRRMRRKYNTRMVREHLAYIREVMPNAAFSADIICGFPGEDDAEFEESVRLVDSLDFLHTHIFTYSRRPGTEADRMPGQVPEDIKNKRAAELIALSEEKNKSLRKKRAASGDIVPVLVEGRDEKEGIMWGHTPDFFCVYFKCDRDLRGEIVDIRLTGADDEKIYGVCV